MNIYATKRWINEHLCDKRWINEHLWLNDE